MDKFQIFEYKFNDPHLEDAFNKFFHKYGLNALFTNEHRAPSISVRYVDARSVINTGGRFKVEKGQRVEYGGAYHEDLKQFADYLLMSNDNKSYEEALFKILYDSRTFDQMMRKIRSLMKYIETSIDSEHMWNMWNIVWYNKSMAYNI